MSKPTRLSSFMENPPRASSRVSAALAVLACASLAPPAHAVDAPRLAVVARSVDQDQGGWLVNYRVRYHGAAGMVVTPTEVTAKVEGWVSNSRVAAHAVPRWSSAVISGAAGLSGTAAVVTAASDSHRCRERAAVQVWTDDAPDVLGGSPPASAKSTSAGAEPRQPILSVAPGATVRVRLRLEHLHDVYGDYDPLLGARAFELHLGTASFRDALPLDREQYFALPRSAWPVPPEERRDTRYFVSAPDSLHLEAHVPGNQYYRFPDRPVRYGTKMRLSYWYLVANGTEGECHARVSQFRDTPTSWKILPEGGDDQYLTAVGRWVKVERVFRTEAEATLLTLDFRISGSEVGEMWVDDIRLEPLVGPQQVGP